jgi:alpha-tubulin suppressor-like RCC1 family protein
LEGDLGNNSFIDSLVPVDVVGLSSGVVSVSAGGMHTCAVISTGAVKCWGFDGSAQLGANAFNAFPYSLVPVDVMGLSSGVVSVSAGSMHTCAVTSAGAIKCWGDNGNGQTGDSATNVDPFPVDVMGLSSGVVSVSAGTRHTCAVTSTGAVKCWGWDGDGALGDDVIQYPSGFVGSLVPVDVVGLSSGGVSVSAGYEHTCAITSTGAVKCWGFNGTGEPDSYVPFDVVGF